MLSVFVLLLLPLAALGQVDAKTSQDEAVRQFPDLAKAGSKFNQAFLAKFQAAKASKDRTLSQNDWPMILATAVATELGVPPVAHTEIEAARAKAFQEGSTFFIWRKDKNPVKGRSFGGVIEFDLSFDLNPTKAWEPFCIETNIRTSLNGQAMKTSTVVQTSIEPTKKPARCQYQCRLLRVPIH
jgi:hypothetical protein